MLAYITLKCGLQVYLFANRVNKLTRGTEVVSVVSIVTIKELQATCKSDERQQCLSVIQLLSRKQDSRIAFF